MRFVTIGLLMVCLSACTLKQEPDPPRAFVPAAITWERVADAPLVRFEAQSTVVDGKLYTLGGYTDGSIIPKSFEANVYDPETDSWSRLPDLPRPITHAGTAAVGENIYLAGGVVGSETPDENEKIPATDEVWRYNTRTKVWSAMPPLPEARGAGALVVLEDTLHFFGGTGTDRYGEVGEHWAMPLDGGEWEVRAPLLNPRNHLAGIVVKGSIYAIGGQHGHNETLVTQDSVERYDAAADHWVKVAPLPHGVGHVQNTTVAVAGRIYLIGGETSGYELYTDEVLVYDPQLDAWSKTTPFPFVASSLLGGAIGNQIYITGGTERDLKTLRGTLAE